MGLTNLDILASNVIGVPGTSFGNSFFVDYRKGSDDDDGTRESPVKTLSEAYSRAVSNNNDAIFIDGDSTVQETAMIDWSKNRIHVFGENGPLPIYGQGAGAKVAMGVTTEATDIATVQVTGVRNTFNGVKFMNNNTLATCLFAHVEAGEYNRYNACEFYKSTLLTTDLTADVLMNGDSSSFSFSTFGTLDDERGASGKERPCVLLDKGGVAGKVTRDGIFYNCRFLQKAAHVDVCFVYGKNADDVERSLLFVNPIFWNSVLATATVADAVNFANAQTVGEVLMINPAGMNITAVAGANLNIYVQNQPDGTTAGVAQEIAA